MECQFCHNIFTTKPIMLSHQKRAKYCLALQTDNTNYEEFKCICGKNYTRNYELIRHQNICMKYNIDKITKECNDKYQEKIQTLKETIQKLEEFAN